MKKELDKSKASFKLDLMETANADPMVTPADFKVLSAYVAVMMWPSGRTWLAVTLGMAMTGLSHGQFWKSRARLLGDNDEGRAYLIAVRQGGKVSTYKLINPWRDEAMALVDARLAYHREAARQKKAARRAARSLQNMDGQKGGFVPTQNGGTNGACPSRICSSVPPEFRDNTPLGITPRKREGRKEADLGPNVVTFKNERKIS